MHLPISSVKQAQSSKSPGSVFIESKAERLARGHQTRDPVDNSQVLSN